MNKVHEAMLQDMISEAEAGTMDDTNEDMIVGTIDDGIDRVVLHDTDEELDDDSDEVKEEDLL